MDDPDDPRMNQDYPDHAYPHLDDLGIFASPNMSDHNYFNMGEKEKQSSTDKGKNLCLL